MAETHAHHHGHHHDARGLGAKRLTLSILLNLTLVFVEAGIGLWANSLALLSDAGHNFTDVLSLVLSWYALWIAQKPATSRKTFGYHRVGILTALFNALTLVIIALFILHEAWERFSQPLPIQSLPMIGAAAVALVVNTVTALWLRQEAAHSVNIRSAFLHMIGDALASAGVIAAGVVIYFTGWAAADPLVSAVIALFIAYTSWDIIVETVNVLLEGTPRGMDIGEVAKAIQAVPGVSGVHDLHAWTIADGMNALSCHLQIEEADAAQATQIVREVKRTLAEEYAVNHSTIETECDGCEPGELFCQMPHHSDTCSHDHGPIQNVKRN